MITMSAFSGPMVKSAEVLAVGCTVEILGLGWQAETKNPAKTLLLLCNVQRHVSSSSSLAVKLRVSEPYYQCGEECWPAAATISADFNFILGEPSPPTRLFYL